MHSKYTICLLSIKQVSFFGDTAESVLERILILMVLIPKVNFVLHNEALIGAALSIALLE